MKNSFKILIIMPRQENIQEVNYKYSFYLGIAYISSVLKKAGYDVDCFNMNHYSGSTKQITSKLLNKKKYDFILTGHTALGYSIVEDIMQTIHNHPSKPQTILGGPIITIESELMFKSLKPSFAVIGEGEVTILKLLEAIRKNSDLSKVQGIGYIDKAGNLKFTKRRKPIKNLDLVPSPDFDGFEFNKKLDNTPANSEYFLFDHPRTYPVLGSRGCPFSCTFCYHGDRYRTRSVKKILEEINIAVKKYKINMILLYDDCFAINRERLNEFCEGIKKLQKEISWELKWSPSLTVHLIDDELLGLMKDAGCEVIGYGFESFSKKILDSMNKPISPQMIDNAFKRTLNAKIGVAANFIFGDINETKETAKETLDYWKKNARGQINLFIVDPYPGSKIYDYCINKGIIKDKLYFIKNQMGHMFDTHLNISSMSNREFNKLKRELIYAELKYGATGKNSVLKGNVLKVNCPFCKTHQIYKNVKSDGFMNYDFLVMCRNCKMRFFARSNLKQFIYNFYPIAKPIHNSYLKIKKFINLGFLRK